MKIVQVAAWMQDGKLAGQISFALAQKLLQVHMPKNQYSSFSVDEQQRQRNMVQTVLRLPAQHLLQACSYLLQLASPDQLCTRLPAQLHRPLLAASVQVQARISNSWRPAAGRTQHASAGQLLVSAAWQYSTNVKRRRCCIPNGSSNVPADRPLHQLHYR